MPEPFLIFGHRGSPKDSPENTLASFEACLAAGADGFETDLRLLSDRTAVLYHDDERDDEPVESLSYTHWVEHGALVQRLSDLSTFAGRCMMVLEVKRSRWEETLIEHISSWPQVVVASFDHTVIAELHRREVDIPLGITMTGCIVDVASYAERIGATWCFPGFHFVDEDLVKALHDRGIKVVPWTTNRRREWDRLREIGVDGIITDLPGEAVEWRDGRVKGEE